VGRQRQRLRRRLWRIFAAVAECLGRGHSALLLLAEATLARCLAPGRRVLDFGVLLGADAPPTTGRRGCT
jgi:hypothetical protein